MQPAQQVKPMGGGYIGAAAQGAMAKLPQQVQQMSQAKPVGGGFMRDIDMSNISRGMAF
jgi:hypothetical protein